MPAIIFALIACVGWGIGDIFSTLATRKIGSLSTSAWSMAIGVLIAAFFIPLAIDDLYDLTLQVFAINILIGLIFILGLVSFNEGLKIGNPSLVGTISASFTAVVVILSVIFLKEQVTVNQAICITIIFSGLILSNFDFNIKNLKRGKLLQGTTFALITMISWGIYYTFISVPVHQIGWFWPQFITLSLFPLLFGLMYFRGDKLSISSIKSSTFQFVALNGLLVTGGEFAYNFAIGQGYTAIVAPIAGSYPVLFVILASFFFKDPITKQQILGIITTLIGIVLLSIFSV